MTSEPVTEDLEYDPERTLWVPGRRSFLFMLGSAIGGLMLPAVRDEELIAAVTEKTILAGHQDYAALLVETFSRDRVFAPFEREISPFHRRMREEGAVFPFEVKVG